MSNRSYEKFHDEIIRPEEAAGLPERFFDRFVFNVHRTDATTPSILFGLGLHPVRDTVDGFTILSTATEQRNVRYSTELSATAPGTCARSATPSSSPTRPGGSRSARTRRD